MLAKEPYWIINAVIIRLMGMRTGVLSGRERGSAVKAGKSVRTKHLGKISPGIIDTMGGRVNLASHGGSRGLMEIMEPPIKPTTLDYETPPFARCCFDV